MEVLTLTIVCRDREDELMLTTALVGSCRVRGYAASAAGVPAVRAVCPPRRGINFPLAP
jgi:hypothetical protein